MCRNNIDEGIIIVLAKAMGKENEKWLGVRRVRMEGRGERRVEKIDRKARELLNQMLHNTHCLAHTNKNL